MVQAVFQYTIKFKYHYMERRRLVAKSTHHKYIPILQYANHDDAPSSFTFSGSLKRKIR